jgi:hypothetical protein
VRYVQLGAWPVLIGLAECRLALRQYVQLVVQGTFEAPGCKVVLWYVELADRSLIRCINA